MQKIDEKQTKRISIKKRYFIICNFDEVFVRIWVRLGFKKFSDQVKSWPKHHIDLSTYWIDFWNDMFHIIWTTRVIRETSITSCYVLCQCSEQFESAVVERQDLETFINFVFEAVPLKCFRIRTIGFYMNHTINYI